MDNSQSYTLLKSFNAHFDHIWYTYNNNKIETERQKTEIQTDTEREGKERERYTDRKIERKIKELILHS